MHQAASPSVAAPPTIRRKKKGRRKLWFALIFLLVIGGLVAASVVNSKREKPIPVTTEKATRITLVQTVSATGKVQPEVEVKISPEVAGEITELPVIDGQAVKKGDLLLKIRPDSYKALLAQQEAAISMARAVLAQQKAAFAKAEADRKRSQDLFDKKMISESEITTARTAEDVARSTMESSLHDIERAEAGSSQARDALAKTTIYSPMDGVITLLNSKLGERVVATNQFAGTEVMRVADLTHMEARVDVNENDVVNVKLGDPATVTIDAYGERKFKGIVQQIANTGKTTGAGTQEEVTNFEVKIQLANPEVPLRPGMSATAEIETNTVKDAVAVPMQSVTIRTGDSNLSPEEIEKKKQKLAEREKGDNNAEVSNEKLDKQNEKSEREKLSKVVFVKSGDVVHMVKVTTGIADNSHIEIKSGLRAGDEVVAGSYSAISRKLKEGAKVKFDTEAK